jgi:hypothetical protein
MMFLGEANDLISPFLQHPDFKEFEKNTPRLIELTEQIQTAMQNTDTNHFLGARCVKVDEETEKAFREFAEICEQGLK